MPVPTKKQGENEEQFINRCMSELSGEYEDVTQRYAVCIGSFEGVEDMSLFKYQYQKKNDINKLRTIGREIAIKKNLFIGEKVSIDFDDTLSTDRGKELAKRLLSEGKDLYIVTRRQEKTASKEVYDVAKEVGIDRNKVHFTNGQLKWKTLQRLGIITHYDNNPDEINAIKINTTGIRAMKFNFEKFESYTDYPDSVKNNAKRGIDLNEKNGNKCATQVGKVRAQQLANGEPISEETIKRMYSYLSRAETYFDNADDNSDCGYISFLLWGGKTALSWSESKIKSFSNQKFEVGVPHYTKDGKLYEGPTHKDASGRLMTGAVHTEDSEYLYHEEELEKVLMAEIGPRGGINPTDKAPKSDK